MSEPDTALIRSLIEKLERLYFPSDAGIASQSVADNNMAITQAIAIVRQHTASPDVIEALKFYADTSKYQAPFTGGFGELYFDCGQRAKAALNAAGVKYHED